MSLKTWQLPIKVQQTVSFTGLSRTVADNRVCDTYHAKKLGTNSLNWHHFDGHEDAFGFEGIYLKQLGRKHAGGSSEKRAKTRLEVIPLTDALHHRAAAPRNSLNASTMQLELFPLRQLACRGQATRLLHRRYAHTLGEAAPRPDNEIMPKNENVKNVEIDSSMDHSPSLSQSLLKYQISAENVHQYPISSSKELHFYSHKLYRGPDGRAPTVHYCRTRNEAERIAKLFAGQKLLGLDLEWRSRMPKGHKATFKESVSVLQLASEERIAIFHLALFSESTAVTLMPPTIKNILRSSDVIKVGVNIKGDCTRLKTHFNVLSNGILELSHLYKLLHHPGSTAKISKAPVKLAQQVEEYLGYALDKSDVRTSDWSKELDDEQMHYAAADAYCAVHLYDIMNRKRLAMSPVPDLPAVMNYEEVENRSKLDPFLRSEAVESWLVKFLSQRDPSYRTRNPLSLRLYAAWQYEGLDLDNMHKLQESMSMTKLSMAYFLLEAIRLENLPFDSKRAKAVLELVPPAAANRYKDIAEATETELS